MVVTLALNQVLVLNHLGHPVEIDLPADLLRMLQGCSSSWYSSSTTINLVSGSRGLNTGLE